MSEKIFIENFEPGLKINEAFYVEEKMLKTARNGRHYLDLTLRDKTGSISAKAWDKAEELNEFFERGDYIKTQGIVDPPYNGKPQLKIITLIWVEEKDIDPEDFKESLSLEAIEKGYQKMLAIIDEVKEPNLAKLLNCFFRDPNFSEKFKRGAGAKTIHHNLAGGLLQHTVYMMTVAQFLAKNIYKDINIDLLIAGTALHDIGKLYELNSDMIIKYTDEGELIGHTMIGINLIREKTAQIPDFPPHLLVLLEHMLLSHHGLPEYGAVKIPMFREAMLLHLIDNIDAKMNTMSKSLKNAPEGELWSDKCFIFEKNQRLLMIDRYLNQTEEAPDNDHVTE